MELSVTRNVGCSLLNDAAVPEERECPKKTTWKASRTKVANTGAPKPEQPPPGQKPADTERSGQVVSDPITRRKAPRT
jgi:hypothetical protein